MKSYLHHTFDENNAELISIMDELPLWSAPFGLSLLDSIVIKKGIRILDIGSGTGFPLIEIAHRTGKSSSLYGVDPWAAANERAKLKIRKFDLKNVDIISGTAENLPFDNCFFDLIVSNNGINNVADLPKAAAEISRVAKTGAQFVFTMNLQGTMKEFYSALRAELELDDDLISVKKMEEQIYKKRKPVDEIEHVLTGSGFLIKEIKEEIFYYKFADAESIFNHSLIKYWFLDGFKSIVKNDKMEEIFDRVENRLNLGSAGEGEIKLSVPFITVNSIKV